MLLLLVCLVLNGLHGSNYKEHGNHLVNLSFPIDKVSSQGVFNFRIKVGHLVACL